MKKGLLQKDVASEADISNCFYSLIESGHRTPSINTASKIATALNLSLDEFYQFLNQNK